MIDYELIPPDAYDNLPEDAQLQFAALAGVAQENFTVRLSKATSISEPLLKQQYVTQILALADELGIQDLLQGSPESMNLDRFQALLAGVLTRIRLRNLRGISSSAVLLGRVGKERIRHEIDRLYDIVLKSELSEARKTKIMQKLDGLREELDKKRMSFMELAIVAATVATIFGETVGGIADFPEARERLVNLFYWVGTEREAEETERLRLAAPPKALPAPEEGVATT